MKTEYKGIIVSITEAFSMQPSSFRVGTHYANNGILIDRISQEDVYINGDPFEYYVGYDKDGNRLFEFKKGTVSVCYE
jgi:hypothetical protein